MFSPASAILTSIATILASIEQVNTPQDGKVDIAPIEVGKLYPLTDIYH